MKFVYMSVDKNRIEHILKHYEDLLSEKHDYEKEKDELQKVVLLNVFAWIWYKWVN